MRTLHIAVDARTLLAGTDNRSGQLPATTEDDRTEDGFSFSCRMHRRTKVCKWKHTAAYAYSRTEATSSMASPIASLAKYSETSAGGKWEHSSLICLWAEVVHGGEKNREQAGPPTGGSFYRYTLPHMHTDIHAQGILILGTRKPT